MESAMLGDSENFERRMLGLREEAGVPQRMRMKIAQRRYRYRQREGTVRKIRDLVYRVLDLSRECLRFGTGSSSLIWKLRETID